MQAAHFRLGTDCVLLADFVHTAGAKRGIDLGCASGALMMLLLERAPNLHMTGLEIVPEAAFLARENMALNGFDTRSEVVIGDIQEEIGKIRITEGLTLEDSICMPEENLKEGMKTLPMSEKPADETEGGHEEGMEEQFEGGVEDYGESTGDSYEDIPEDGEGFGVYEGGDEGTGLETGGPEVGTGFGLESGD